MCCRSPPKRGQPLWRRLHSSPRLDERPGATYAGAFLLDNTGGTPPRSTQQCGLEEAPSVRTPDRAGGASPCMPKSTPLTPGQLGAGSADVAALQTHQAEPADDSGDHQLQE